MPEETLLNKVSSDAQDTLMVMESTVMAAFAAVMGIRHVAGQSPMDSRWKDAGQVIAYFMIGSQAGVSLAGLYKRGIKSRRYSDLATCLLAGQLPLAYLYSYKMSPKDFSSYDKLFYTVAAVLTVAGLVGPYLRRKGRLTFPNRARKPNRRNRARK